MTSSVGEKPESCISPMGVIICSETRLTGLHVHKPLSTTYARCHFFFTFESSLRNTAVALARLPKRFQFFFLLCLLPLPMKYKRLFEANGKGTQTWKRRLSSCACLTSLSSYAVIASSVITFFGASTEPREALIADTVVPNSYLQNKTPQLTRTFFEGKDRL